MPLVYDIAHAGATCQYGIARARYGLFWEEPCEAPTSRGLDLHDDVASRLNLCPFHLNMALGGLTALHTNIITPHGVTNERNTA